jgi:intracellular multiplication protein IcmB
MVSRNWQAWLLMRCIDGVMMIWRMRSHVPILPRLDAEIDDIIQKYSIHLPTDPYWWDVVENLFDTATLFTSCSCAAACDANASMMRLRQQGARKFERLLEETTIGASAESVISAFERMVTSAVRDFPDFIICYPVRYCRSARICSIDLMDISPQGDENADRQTAVMYMLARQALVRAWWVGSESLPFIPEKFRNYHERNLQDLAESPKRLCYDEFHRTSSSSSVRAQVVRDVREGRKRGVQIVLASQLLGDFDDDMVDLATGVWVLGTAVSDKAVDDIRDRFGLSATARNIIRFRLTGPRAGGAPALLILGTNEGRYEQHLINTLGPIELWAFATSVEDVIIRNRLYAKFGAGRARQMLAVSFPGGSARSELKRRVLLKSDSGDSKSAAMSAIVDELVEELIDTYNKLALTGKV